MSDQHDMTSVGRDRKTVTVHYCGMTEWVKVRGGVILKASEGAELFGYHAVNEAKRALKAIGVEAV